MMFNHGDSMWFGGGFMWLFWAGIIIAILLLVKFLASNNYSGTTPRHPMTILKQRYAQGEINEEEYMRRKKELEDESL